MEESPWRVVEILSCNFPGGTEEHHQNSDRLCKHKFDPEPSEYTSRAPPYIQFLIFLFKYIKGWDCINKHAILEKLSIYLFILYLEIPTGLTEDKNKGTYQILLIIAFLFQLL